MTSDSELHGFNMIVSATTFLRACEFAIGYDLPLPKAKAFVENFDIDDDWPRVVRQAGVALLFLLRESPSGVPYYAHVEELANSHDRLRKIKGIVDELARESLARAGIQEQLQSLVANDFRVY